MHGRRPALGALPIVAGAVIGGAAGYRFVDGVVQGRPSLWAAFARLDYVSLLAQSVGGLLGAMAGAAIPVPVLGPICGGIAGAKLAVWLIGKAERGVQMALDEPGDVPTVALLPLDSTVTETGRSAAYLAFLHATGRGDREETRRAYEDFVRSTSK